MRTRQTICVWLSGLLFIAGSVQAQSGEELISMGDRLAEQAKYTEALTRYKEAYEKILTGMRGLPFKESVAPNFMERSALQEHMKRLFHEEMSDSEIALADASLKVFGLVPLDFNTEKMVLDLHAEEVAGFYDPKRKQIFLIQETEKPQKPGLLARLLGARSGFDKEEQKSTLSHEMAHALADQHFDLVKLTEAVEQDDDRSLALQALVEGEAMLVMMAELERAGGGDPQAMIKASPAAIDFTFRLMQGILPFASGKSFRNAPAIFRETMVFPYLKGMVFILHLTNASGWERVNEAFRHPPRSTEQVIHPEKYLVEVDEPTELVLPPLGDAVGVDWTELGQNVLGELQISILLRRHWGVRAAAGWDGDRYAVFRGPEQDLGLVWYTTWDSESDAQEFAGAYSRYLSTRLDLTEPRSTLNQESRPPAVADRLRFAQAGRAYQIERRGQDVFVIEGFSESQLERIASALEHVGRK